MWLSSNYGDKTSFWGLAAPLLTMITSDLASIPQSKENACFFVRIISIWCACLNFHSWDTESQEERGEQMTGWKKKLHSCEKQRCPPNFHVYSPQQKNGTKKTLCTRHIPDLVTLNQWLAEPPTHLQLVSLSKLKISNNPRFPQCQTRKDSKDILKQSTT